MNIPFETKGVDEIFGFGIRGFIKLRQKTME
jgi:hypothetical protein